MPNFLLMTFVVLLWTASSFGCHFFAKAFLTWSNNLNYLGGLLITSCQLTCIYSVLELNNQTNLASNNRFKSILVFVTHALGTFSTNMSLSHVDASATMSIKVMEPITTCLMQRFFFQKYLSRKNIFTLPMICIGVLIFLNDAQSLHALSLGIIWGLCSNMFYGLRNIYIKDLKSKNINVSIRRFQDMALVLCWILFIGGLVLGGIIKDDRFIQLTVSAVLSSLFHLSYTHLSIVGVLSFVSVVTHALFNVTKRILVVIFFVLVGHVVKSNFNWSGLILANVGLALHFGIQYENCHEKTDKQDQPKQETFGKSQIFSSILLASALLWFQLSTSWEFEAPNPKNISVVPTHVMKNDWTNLNLLEQHYLIRNRVVNEIKQTQMDYYTKLLQKFPKVAVIELADSENKGDPAISVGEMMLLQQITNVEVIYYNMHQQSLRGLDHAKEVIGRFPVSKVMIMFQGGGSIFAYKTVDAVRRRYFEAFPNHTMTMFPQSIWPFYENETLANYIQMYNSRKNLFIGVRDPRSFKTAQTLIPNANLTEVPDMAFQIGPLPRIRLPVYDILLLIRKDKEGFPLGNFTFPTGISYRVQDWVGWKSAFTEDLDILITMLSNGLSFLQRGKVVITNRLHGHILSTLSGIPHVIMECRADKILPLHYKYTKDIAFIKVAHNTSHAIDLAVQLLDTYSDSIPNTLTFNAPFN